MIAPPPPLCIVMYDGNERLKDSKTLFRKERQIRLILFTRIGVTLKVFKRREKGEEKKDDIQ